MIEGVLGPFIDQGDIVRLCRNELIPTSAPVESFGGRVMSSIFRGSVRH